MGPTVYGDQKYIPLTLMSFKTHEQYSNFMGTYMGLVQNITQENSLAQLQACCVNYIIVSTVTSRSLGLM